MKWIWLVIPVVVLGVGLLACTSKKNGHSGLGGTGERFSHTKSSAPKTIASKEIHAFSYQFSTAPLTEGHDQPIPYNPCTFTLQREADGVHFTGSGGGYTGYFALFEFATTVPFSALDDLQVLIDKHNVAAVNGVNETVQGITEEFTTRLRVTYASGEKIYAYDNSGPILSDDATRDLYHFFLGLAQNADRTFMYSAEDFWTLHQSLSNRFEDKQGRFLVFENFTVDVFEDETRVAHAAYFVKGDFIYAQTRDNSIADYAHFAWRDGALFAIKKDGAEVAFFPVTSDSPL
ncbi:MAG: hypothetical protein M0R76_14025 [Proteobacteria bacterium]|nr:hypothetical protein [Pseudomonadota bacterium]